MSGGAIIAAAAAARAKRVQNILDAYRVAGATSPNAARDPAELLTDDDRLVLEDMLEERILMPGPRDRMLYLSERGYIDYRERQSKGRGRALIFTLVLLLGAVAALLYAGLRKRFG